MAGSSSGIVPGLPNCACILVSNKKNHSIISALVRMSTLPPEPTYNPNIPIISSAGGTAVAYKDPNSPESIMKKATLVQAQSQVDSKYDVNLAAVTKEGFQVSTMTEVYILFIFVTLLLITLFTQTTKMRKLFILTLASLLLLLSIYLLQRNVRP
jgi:hypothetical protein